MNSKNRLWFLRDKRAHGVWLVLVIGWAIFTGLYDIIVCGSYVIFSLGSDSFKNNWEYSFFQILGSFDKRFYLLLILLLSLLL